MNLIDQIKGIESEDIPEIYILYNLFELAMKVTGRGDVSDDYTKTIEFELGELNIILDEYYSRLTILIEGCEYEIDERDSVIDNLKEEIKKRILEFDKKTKRLKEKISEEVFDKPINKEILNKITGEE